MKKTVIGILIILVVCAIACVCVIGLSGKDGEATDEISASQSTTEEGNSLAEHSGTSQANWDSQTQASATDSQDLRFDDLDGDSQLGEAIVSSTQSTEAEASGEIIEVTTEFPDCFDLELEILSQYPELPAGCESVSLTMILNYLGYNIDKTVIVDEYLVYDGNFVMGYSGDPYSYEVGGGCYAPGMTLTANNFLEANGNKHIAENITGTDFDVLLEYVAQGHPILIWTTINMAYCNKGYYNYDTEGNAYAWDYNEHCVVLSGYDLKAGTVTVYDPIAGIVYRDREAFESIYNDMDQMAIIIK